MLSSEAESIARLYKTEDSYVIWTPAAALQARQQLSNKVNGKEIGLILLPLTSVAKLLVTWVERQGYALCEKNMPCWMLLYQEAYLQSFIRGQGPLQSLIIIKG